MAKASDKVMSRIMKLLDKANHANTPPAEAKLAEEHAERLMAQWQIDRMDLTVEEKSKVETDYWDLRVGDVKGEFAAHMSSLMKEVLKHCGVRVNEKFTYPKDDEGVTDWGTRRYQIVGFPEDMAYAERIWFRVFKEFVSNLAPKWSKDATIAQNAYSLVNAGFEWQQIVLMANAAGDERMPVSELERCGDYRSRNYGKQIPVKGNRPLIRGIQMLRKGHKEECERRGESAAYRKGANLRAASRTSYAMSFNSTIRQRLAEMRKATKETVSDKDKYALAVRTTAEQVDEEFYRLFPEYDPKVQEERRKREEFLRACNWASLSPEEQKRILREDEAAERRWQARMNRARNNHRAMYRDNTDYAAWERGRRSAQSVNLRDDGEVKNKAKKGIK
jgi:hypothetical protein